MTAQSQFSASADCDLPRTRAAAAQAGAHRYFTGEPCPAGHNTARYTLNGTCVSCQREATRLNRLQTKARMEGKR